MRWHHIRAGRLLLSLAAAVSAPVHAQLDEDRDLARDLSTLTPQAFVLEAAVAAVPVRSFTFGLRSTATSAAVDSKLDLLPLSVIYQFSADSPWTLRANTNGLGVKRPEGQAAVGGWTNTQLLLIRALDPLTSIIGRVTVPAHGGLGSSEPEYAVRVSHIHKNGAHNWTGILTASHQKQATPGVSPQQQSVYVEWTRDKGGPAVWTVSFLLAHRRGLPDTKEGGIGLTTPFSFSTAGTDKPWKAGLSLGRKTAGTSTETSATASLSRKLAL